MDVSTCRLTVWATTIVRTVSTRLRGCGDAGASLVEYALLLALIAVVAVGALVFLGHSVSNTLNTVANNISTTNAP
ncbi:MAG: Flp family type IVb pilin [Acidimicrobiales bacterium]